MKKFACIVLACALCGCVDTAQYQKVVDQLEAQKANVITVLDAQRQVVEKATADAERAVAVAEAARAQNLANAAALEAEAKRLSDLADVQEVVWTRASDEWAKALPVVDAAIATAKATAASGGQNAAGTVGAVATSVAPVLPPPWNLIVAGAGALAGIAGGVYGKKKSGQAVDTLETLDLVNQAFGSVIGGLQAAKKENPALAEALKQSKATLLEHYTDDAHAAVETGALSNGFTVVIPKVDVGS